MYLRFVKIIMMLTIIFIVHPASIIIGSAELQKVKIVIVTGASRASRSRWTAEHLRGITEFLNTSALNVKIMYYNVENIWVLDEKIWETVRVLDPDLIITNGTKLGYYALRQKWDIPLILSGCMAIDELEYHSNHDVGIVSYDYPYGVYLSALKQAFPTVERIGIGYSPDYENKFSALNRTATQMGINLISFKAESTKEILSGSESILPHIDIMYCIPWFFSFSEIIDIGSLEKINLTFFKYGVPYATIHPLALDMGACFCMLPDYYEIGRQTGELVLDRIEHGPFDEPVILEPQNYQFVVNESMTSRLGIQYPEEFINKAVIVGRRPSPDMAEKH